MSIAPGKRSGNCRRVKPGVEGNIEQRRNQIDINCSDFACAASLQLIINRTQYLCIKSCSKHTRKISYRNSAKSDQLLSLMLFAMESNRVGYGSDPWFL